MNRIFEQPVNTTIGLNGPEIDQRDVLLAQERFAKLQEPEKNRDREFSLS